MPRTATLTLELPVDVIDDIRARVASGAWPNESAVVLDALAALEGEGLDDGRPTLEGPELERWLREEVVPAYDRMKADPSQLMTIDEARKRLRLRSKSRTSA